jgi:hypothetical protein
VALTAACVVATIVAGGVCEKVRDGGCATIVVKAIAGFDGVDAGEDAVIVTKLPAGTAVGALKMICPELAVCAGERLKLPHAPALPQLAVQFTPRLPVSPVTFAASGA